MNKRCHQLNDYTFQNLNIAKVYSEGDSIECIDYHDSGKYLVSASTGSAINVYDIREGEQVRKIFSKVHGTSLVKFTHQENTILYCGSHGQKGSLNYLSLHDNLHLRMYYGHSKPICSMDISPLDDSFITSSLDNTARLWDLRLPRSRSVVVIPSVSGPSALVFDPMGLIFALGKGPGQVKLYNLKKLELGPFNDFTVHLLRDADSPQIDPHLNITDLKFDATGKYLLVTMNDCTSYLLDAFNGATKAMFRTNRERKISNCPVATSFTPDGKYILGGGLDGSICCWKTDGSLLYKWNQIHTGPVKCLKFNPIYLNMTSADRHLVMWLDVELDEEVV